MYCTICGEHWPEPRFVQVQNPKSKEYIKIDRKSGKIIGHRKTPYKVQLIKLVYSEEAKKDLR